MPEFALDLGESAKDWRNLDSFTQGYIEAAFFTECEHGTDSETHDPETQSSLPGDMCFDDLAPETLKRMAEDCTDFNFAADAWLDKAYQHNADYTMHQAGIDFWLTRNGHGAGFWDRGLGAAGDKLSELSRPYGTVNLYLGDAGKIYCD